MTHYGWQYITNCLSSPPPLPDPIRQEKCRRFTKKQLQIDPNISKHILTYTKIKNRYKQLRRQFKNGMYHLERQYKDSCVGGGQKRPMTMENNNKKGNSTTIVCQYCLLFNSAAKLPKFLGDIISLQIKLSWITKSYWFKLLVVSGLQAVCHVRIMRRWSSNLKQWTIQRPRLWVPRPYSLSPTRQSKPAFQWQGKNERIHRQWQQGTKQTQDRHGGHQFTYGSSVTSLVTGGTVFFPEQPGETITQ